MKDTLLQAWAKQYSVVFFNRNQRIFMQGEPFSTCYLVTSGICGRSVLEENGTEVIMKYYFAGDLLGLWYCFMQQMEELPATVIAKTPVYAYAIPVEALRRKMMSDFPFYRELAEKNVLRSRDHENLEVMFRKKAKGSSAEVVCYTIRALLLQNRSGQMYLSKYFTHTELALHLRLHRMTISRIFAELEESEILHRTPEGWVVQNMAALNAYANGNAIMQYET